MNLNPNQDDAPHDASPLDEGLLNEALQPEPTPAELEAKILELTDPQMLSLLDEALAPEAPSDALTQRILAATGSGAHDQAPAVLARIGPAPLRYAAAAAIALAVGLGAWFVVNESPDDTGTPFAHAPNTPTGTTDNSNSTDDPTDPDWIDSAQYALNENVFEATTDAVAVTLEDAADSLDDVTISRDTIWSELDAYEQFLTDIEADETSPAT